MSQLHGMSFHRRAQYLREQQRETKFAPRIHCKGPHIRRFELLSRTILFPDHAKTDGSLKEEGISRNDLTRYGFSIFRISYTDINTVKDIVAKQIKKVPARSLVGASTFLTKSARHIIDKDGYQAFVIIDSSETPDLTGHALLLCAEKLSPAYVKELRHELTKIMCVPINLEDIFTS